jgi:hypothetical protein
VHPEVDGIVGEYPFAEVRRVDRDQDGRFLQPPASLVVTEHRGVADLHGTPRIEVDRPEKSDDAVDVPESRRGLEEIKIDDPIKREDLSRNRSQTGIAFSLNRCRWVIDRFTLTLHRSADPVAAHVRTAFSDGNL